jgi:hypothetical protein
MVGRLDGQDASRRSPGAAPGQRARGRRRIELSIQGTSLGPFETPAGVIQPTGAKLDIPTADFWDVRDGKIQTFICHIGTTTMFAQLGVLPDFASAVAASAPER